MAHRVQWRELTPGLLAAACTLAIAVLILVFARVGALHGRTDRIYAEIDEARGILRGTEVWVDGQKVGLVKSIDFRPPDTDPSRRLVLSLDILHDYVPHIRLNSRVHIQSGGSILGSQVVYISEGTTHARAVREGDTLVAERQSDFESAASQFGMASRQFPAIIANVKVLATELRSTRGTLGAFGIEQGGPSLARTSASANRLMTRLGSSRGTLGAILGGGTLTGRARQLTAGVDSVRRLLASNRSSLGRFRRDSSLTRQLAALQSGLDSVAAQARSPNGSLGRFGADSAVFQSLAQAQAEMAALMADLQRHPLRYVHF